MINWIDILLVFIIAISAFAGWKRGLIVGAVDLLAWGASVLLSFLMFPYVSNAMGKMFPSLGIWITPVAFLSTFLIVRLVFSFLAGLVLGAIPPGVQASPVNKALGLLPGFINGLITAAIVALIIMVLPLQDGLATQVENSKVAGELSKRAMYVENNLSPVVDSAIHQTVAGLSIEPGKNDYIVLHYKTTNYKVRQDLEAQMLQLVNEERKKSGLQALAYDTALTSVARAHSADMFERGYFSHITPEGKDPFARMHDSDITYITAGENLALAQTLKIAHNGLMRSPGHKANILNRDFTSVGIGVLDGGYRGLMISQEFKH